MSLIEYMMQLSGAPTETFLNNFSEDSIKLEEFASSIGQAQTYEFKKQVM